TRLSQMTNMSSAAFSIHCKNHTAFRSVSTAMGLCTDLKSAPSSSKVAWRWRSSVTYHNIRLGVILAYLFLHVKYNHNPCCISLAVVIGPVDDGSISRASDRKML